MGKKRAFPGTYATKRKGQIEDFNRELATGIARELLKVAALLRLHKMLDPCVTVSDLLLAQFSSDALHRLSRLDGAGLYWNNAKGAAGVEQNCLTRGPQNEWSWAGISSIPDSCSCFFVGPDTCFEVTRWKCASSSKFLE